MREETTTLSVKYTVPIMGHVYVWFKKPILTFGEVEPKHDYLFPVSTILQVAKVSASISYAIPFLTCKASIVAHLNVSFECSHSPLLKCNISSLQLHPR